MLNNTIIKEISQYQLIKVLFTLNKAFVNQFWKYHYKTYVPRFIICFVCVCMYQMYLLKDKNLRIYDVQDHFHYLVCYCFFCSTKNPCLLQVDCYFLQQNLIPYPFLRLYHQDLYYYYYYHFPCWLRFHHLNLCLNYSYQVLHLLFLHRCRHQCHLLIRI